jgi:NADH-quinone oxidoreductase chain 15
MSHGNHHDEQLYQSWVELLGWMQEYARENKVSFVKESDFPDFIYRMERAYDVPTTTMAASISDGRGEPFLFASVSARHAEMKHVELRIPGGQVHYHAHFVEGKGLALEGKIALTKAKLYSIAERANTALAR